MSYPTAEDLKTMTRPEKLKSALQAWCEVHAVQIKHTAGKVLIVAEETGEELLSIALAGRAGIE